MLLAVAGVLFLGALLVLAVVLWRSPVRLAATITRPLDRRLQELAVVLRESTGSIDARLADHERRLQVLEGDRNP